jgi:hypothetical protein
LAERLVRLGWYPSLVTAERERQRLEDAGLDGYVGTDPQNRDDSIDLLVPESQLDAARSHLGIEPESEPPPEIEVDPTPAAWPGTRRCPECRSIDVRKLPPYAGWVLVGSAALMAATAALGKAWIGGAGLLIGWVLAMLLGRHAGHYRCRACGREWKP